MVDESMLAGESMPVRKGPDATVVGASINKSCGFRYEATTVGADSALSQIAKNCEGGAKLYPFVLSREVAALSLSGSTLMVAMKALMPKRNVLS